MCQYMIRVLGLGPVEALFLPDVANDDLACQRMELCAQADQRMKITGLFRIEKIDVAGDVEEKAFTIFFLTGIPDKEKGDVKNLFFGVQTSSDAQEYARTQRWNEARLYRCKRILIE